MSEKHDEIARVVVEEHGETVTEAAGFELDDKPAPLFRLLVLTLLLSARITSEIAVAAGRELAAAGMTTPRKTADASWQQRVDALGRGHYRRYDERTATQLGELAEKVLDEYGGDLRRLRDSDDMAAALESFKGIGPTGASIFLREVQAVWPELTPYVDDLTADGAKRLGLPTSADALAATVPTQHFPRLVAGCVKAARDKGVVEDVRRRLGD